MAEGFGRASHFTSSSWISVIRKPTEDPRGREVMVLGTKQTAFRSAKVPGNVNFAVIIINASSSVISISMASERLTSRNPLQRFLTPSVLSRFAVHRRCISSKEKGFGFLFFFSIFASWIKLPRSRRKADTLSKWLFRTQASIRLHNVLRQNEKAPLSSDCGRTWRWIACVRLYLP